jgi:hypothetical protein
MSVQSTIALPTRRRRGLRYLAAATLAAGVTAAALALVVSSGTEQAGTHPVARMSIPATRTSIRATSAAQDARAVPSIMSLTPARLAAGALGRGYALLDAQRGPTTESVLASMSPETRRYTRAVMSLTFAQLAAGAAGSP